MREDKRARQLEKLEEARRRTDEILLEQRRRVDERFERARQRILKDYSDPSADQKRIIDAALELLDEVGLQELSLRKLADKLDLKAPALYWHFKNKEALIDYMAEAILQATFHDLQPRADDEPWQDWLLGICKRLRKAMLHRRDGARVIAGAHMYPAVTLMRLFETSMQSLMSAGLERQRANLVLMTTVHFVFGNVIEEQSSPSLEEIESLDLDALSRDFPLMRASIDDHIADTKAGRDEFEEALRLIIGYNA